MNSLRAQDILKHITGDEDYGVAMMQKLPLDEAIAVEGDLLNACIKEADEKKNANDAAFFGDMQEAFRPIIIDKIRNESHLWVIYSDVNGYPYDVDGDMLVVYDYNKSKEITDRLNAQGYLAVLSLATPEQFANEVAHMYRNGYKNVRFVGGNETPFIVSREELYPYDKFMKEDYVTNPALSQAMIALFQETRKTSKVEEGAPEEAFTRMLKKREEEFVTALKNAEFMVPCVKTENGEEIEISFQYLDITEQIGSDNGEKVIAIPAFTDGFEMNKCYPGKTEDMLCTFDELVATVVELGASGIIINALGISHYMSVKTLEAL